MVRSTRSTNPNLNGTIPKSQSSPIPLKTKKAIKTVLKKVQESAKVLTKVIKKLPPKPEEVLTPIIQDLPLPIPKVIFTPKNNKQNLTTPKRIAHAGGGMTKLDGTHSIYNNNASAILHNLTLGFTWFELDFRWCNTTGKLVTDGDRAATTSSKTACYYDAKDDGFASTIGGNSKKSLCLGKLGDLMNCKEGKDMVIVTDLKEPLRNVEAMGLMTALPNYRERVICQIYQPEEYQEVKDLGFRNIIWTLYNYHGGDEKVLSLIKDMDLVGVTMPIPKVKSGLARKVKLLGHKVFTHTVNDVAGIEELVGEEFGVDEVYSDFLFPGCEDA